MPGKRTSTAILIINNIYRKNVTYFEKISRIFWEGITKTLEIGIEEFLTKIRNFYLESTGRVLNNSTKSYKCASYLLCGSRKFLL
jgi:malonyl CoA-acyl carrier protein transacylase